MPERKTSVWAVVNLGFFLAVMYAGATLPDLSLGTSSGVVVVQLLVGILLPIIIIGAGVWLGRTELSEELRWKVAMWSFGGLAILTVITGWGLYLRLLTGPNLSNILKTFILNAQAGALAGFAVGVYDARADKRKKKLEELNARLELALEGTTTGVWEWDLQTDEVIWDEQMEELFGYEIGEFPGNYEGFADRVHPEDLPRVEREHERGIEKGYYAAEYRVFVNGETIRWVKARAKIFYEDGEATRMVGVVTDITESRERERKVKRELERRKEAETRYRSLFENNPVVIWEEDLSEAKEYVDELSETVNDLRAYLDENPDEMGRIMERVEIIDVNENALDYYGAESKEELMESLDDIMTEESVEANKQLWLSVAEGETEFRSETVSRTLDGEKRNEILEMYVPEAYEDDFSRVYITGTDITERKRRERRMEELTEEYETIIEAADDSIFLIGVEDDGEETEFRYEKVNEAHEELTGMKPDELRGKTPREVVGGEIGAEVEENYQRCLEAEDSIRYEEVVPFPEGERTWQTTLAPTVVDGEVTRIVGISRDITDRVKRERELEETKEKLEQSNEQLEQFASAVSHDLQEPLRMISSYLQLLADEYEGELEEAADEYIEFAVDGAERMQEMIEALLEYSRVESRSHEFEELDTEEVLEDVLLDLELLIESENATVTRESLPKVEGDRNQIAQLFQNLIKNGIEHSAQEPPEIHIGFNEKEEEYEFFVEDNGVGIPEEEQERVFKIFERGSHRNDETGTGIGLALCSRIVEKHGGDMSLESEVGEGTKFYFTVPKEQRSAN